MNKEVISAIVMSFAISVILCPVIIPFLQRLKFGQYIREEGPKRHLKKTGTPTMGGLIILAAILITSMAYVRDNKEIIPILFMTLGYGLIGFLDDYIKVVMKRNLGLKSWQKMALQILVAGIFSYYLTNYAHIGTNVIIPFTDGMVLELNELYIPFIFLVTIGTVNGANFTDGLDGLVSGVTVIIAVFFTAVAITMDSSVEIITCAVVGSLMGFLLFNVYPAKVFMGDTGSLALGGFVASTAIMLKMPLFILIVGFAYFVEVLSVIMQVVYFKLSGGKRIFKMAPIHHHFELCGWSETRIVAMFSIVTTILCLVALEAI